MIPEPADQIGHRKRRGSAGGRPPRSDADDYRKRSSIERRFCDFKLWRGLATRYDKLAIVYRAAAVLNAVIAWARRLSDLPSPSRPEKDAILRALGPCYGSEGIDVGVTIETQRPRRGGPRASAGFRP